MKVDLSSIPIMINSNQYQSDISAFLGILYLTSQVGKIKESSAWPFKTFNFIIYHLNNGLKQLLKKLMFGKLKYLYPNKKDKYLN